MITPQESVAIYGRVYPGQAPGTIPLCCCTTAWVVNQEREVARRRTKEGLAARARGIALDRR